MNPGRWLRQRLTASSRAAASDVLPHQRTLGIPMDWTPTTYGEYYTKSVPVYAAVRVRAQAVARVHLRVSRAFAGGKTIHVERDHPAQAILDAPNPYMTLPDFLEAVETNLCLWGRAHASIEPSQETGRLELWPLRPDRLRVQPGPGRVYVQSYTYEGATGLVEYTAQDVITWLYYNPLQDRTGLSPIAPLRKSADTALAAVEFNRATFRNGGMPDFAVITEEPQTTEQARQWYQVWDERFGGPDRSHRPALLGGAKSIQELAFSSREMEYVEGLRMTIKDAGRVYGIPETMLGELQHSTQRANTRELEAWFWRNTALPELARLASRINAQLLPRLGYTTLTAAFDTTALEPLMRDEALLLKQEQSDLDRGVITVNEVRAARGLPPVAWGAAPRQGRHAQPTREATTLPPAQPSAAHNGAHP